MDLRVEIRKLAMQENVTLTELAKYIENKKRYFEYNRIGNNS